MGSDGSFGSMSLQLDMVGSTTQTSTGSRTKTASEGRETTGDANIDLIIVGYKGGHKDVTGNTDANTASNALTSTSSSIASSGWAITLKTPPAPVRAADPTYTNEVFFDVNSPVPKGDQGSKLQEWFLRLPPAVRDGLKSGKYKISLQGQASRTGASDYNIQLSARRNESVAKLLKKVVPGIKVSDADYENAGYLLSKNPPKSESPGDKVVHIEIEPATP